MNSIKIHKNIANIFVITILLVWYIWVLYPLLETGFVGDDAYNSQIKGTLILSDATLLERLTSEIKGWLIGAGRFNPIGWIYTWSLYYLTNSFLIVKSIAMGVIILSSIFFFMIIKKIEIDKLFLLLGILIMPTIMQFRQWHDPIISFTFLIPLVTLFSFISIYSYIRSFDKFEIKWVSISILFFILSLLTYEVSYFFLPIYFAIFLFYKKTRFDFILISTFIILLVAHYILCKISLDYKSSAYPASQIHLNWGDLWRAYKYQFISGFPLTWRLAKNIEHVKIFPLIGYQTYIFSILSIILYYIFNKWQYKVYKNYKLIIIGLLLIFLIPLPSALSGHQSEISSAGPGYGYITVYIQYFGVAVMLLVAVNFLLNYKKHKNYIRVLISIILSILIAFSALITRNENNFVVKKLDYPYKTPRIFLGQSIQSGLLNQVSSRDIVLSNYRIPADNAWFLSQSADKKIFGCSINIDAEYIPCIKRNKARAPDGDVYGLVYQISHDDEKSYALLAKLIIPSELSTSSNVIKFTDYLIYRNSKLEKISGIQEYDFIALSDAPIKLEKSNFDINSYSLGKFPINFQSFWLPDRSDHEVLRWSSGDSLMNIYNPLGKSVSVLFTSSLVRPNNGEAEIYFLLNNQLVNFYQVKSNFAVNLNLRLMPGENKLRFFSNAPVVSGGDPRKIVFGLVNPQVKEIN